MIPLKRRDEILSIAARHGATNLRIFGSAARGEAGPDSDIDFLVDFSEGRSLMDQAAMILDLTNLLERKVDVVELEALHWTIREHILREAVPL